MYGGCCVGEGLWLQVWLGVGLASVVIAVFLLQRYFDAAGLLGETGALRAFEEQDRFSQQLTTTLV